MEAQTDIQTYLEQGKQALAKGQGREAAIAYAHGAQMEPENPMVHLGLAEANLALGNYGVVQMACRRVQELQPAGGLESMTAQSLLDLLDRRYERALQGVDAVIREEPGIAYAHALRAHLLRVLGQDYDANLAIARAARLSYGGRFEGCFPPVQQVYGADYNSNTAPKVSEQPQQNGQPRVVREPTPSWSPPNQMQRQIIRTRFALNQYPFLVTYTLIAVNVVMFLLSILFPTIQIYGVQANDLVLQGEFWRIFTAMFLHENILHIGLNMLSLFFIGRAVEIFYGKWRYLTIYLVSGIIGGITFLFLSPDQAALGASGAIFGVFGALGIFYLMNRRALGGYGSGAVSNWLFWLLLNLAFGFAPGSDIAIWAHIGGLIGGMLLAYLLTPRQRPRRTF
ncbi:MAG TPA: rhomboid family intramembrane serine protease [Ktedonobacteraceae bacterium]|nr:rhomboid family intramembrane serine protease [Ktedonobacteraceae bacterium]